MKPRDRLVLGMVALAGLLGALWFGLLAPKREQAAGLQVKVTAAVIRRDAANATATQAQQTRVTFGHDDATLARLGKATPPQADVASLVYQLDSAARHAKVDFRSVTFQDAAAAPPTASGAAPSKSTTAITPVPFSFTFVGSFFKLQALLRSIARFSRFDGHAVKISGRLLTLDAVTLSPGGSGFPQVKAQITARAYTAPIPDPPPAGTAPGAGSSASPGSTGPAAQVTK